MKLLPFFLVILLAACSEQKVDKVTRIAVEITDEKDNYEELISITDSKRIQLIEDQFKKITWQPNVQVLMSRKEDVLVTFFNKYDENMPERLYEYRIWFNKSSAEIISKKENESYGKLDEEDSKKLKELLAN
ncbi:hypothetical protein VBD025_14475 [Virgibacillus flavescens]|uniref:hypothetical protein n=1 Tax=Virgibacillus flavescens TaxID=1611422 RepID=UPI003D34DB3E